MQLLEVSGAVRTIYGSLGDKDLTQRHSASPVFLLSFCHVPPVTEVLWAPKGQFCSLTSQCPDFFHRSSFTPAKFVTSADFELCCETTGSEVTVLHPSEVHQ